MHDNDFIQKFEPADLVVLMKAIGCPAQQHRAMGAIDVAARTIDPTGRPITYFVYLEGEALQIVGRLILKGPPSNDYVVRWNNLCPIAPLVGTDDGALLKFALNVRRSTTFASFRTVVTEFEKQFHRLGSELTE